MHVLRTSLYTADLCSSRGRLSSAIMSGQAGRRLFRAGHGDAAATFRPDSGLMWMEDEYAG